MAATQSPTTYHSHSWRDHFLDGDLWVFGYGSLIWKPPPHYDQRVPGYIEGYVRRFWQASGDHRGTPESPGRVVTVIEASFWETLDDPQKHLEQSSSTPLVWGAAYHIPASHAEEVHAYLDDREIDGYTVHYTPFHPHTTLNNQKKTSAAPMTCMVYIGLPTNPQFLNKPSLRDPLSVAQVINASRGQSGDNREYVYLLEKALEGLGLGSADGHVSELARLVRKLEGSSEIERRKSDAAVERLVSPEQIHPDTPDEFEKEEES